LPAIFGADVT